MPARLFESRQLNLRLILHAKNYLFFPCDIPSFSERIKIEIRHAVSETMTQRISYLDFPSPNSVWFFSFILKAE